MASQWQLSQGLEKKSLELVKEIINGARSTLYVVREGRATLAAGNRSENLICIFGKLKRGKSTLANMLLGRNAVFAMGSRGPCTTGIDMSPYPVPVKALQLDPFTGSSSISLSNLSLSEGEGFRVLDVEGAGDKGSDYDRRLYIPALLMSKVCIFNCQGQVGKQSFLNEVFGLIKAGEEVVPDGLGGLFGHLHVVLRDFDFDVNADEYRDYLLLDENAGKGQGAISRNRQREKLRVAFLSVTLHFFPRPSADVQGVISLDELWRDRAFADAVLTLRRIIHEQLRRTTVYNKRSLLPRDGPSALVVVDHVLQKVNRDGLISPAGIVDAIVWKAFECALKVLHDGQHQLRSAARQMPPMSPAALQSLLQEKKKQVEQSYQEKVGILWSSSLETSVKFNKLMLRHRELQSEIIDLYRYEVDEYGFELTLEYRESLKRFFRQLPGHVPHDEISKQLMDKERQFSNKLHEHMPDATVSGPWLEACRKYGQQFLLKLKQERIRQEQIENERKEEERARKELERLEVEAQRVEERLEQVRRDTEAHIAQLMRETENRRKELLRVQEEEAYQEERRKVAEMRNKAVARNRETTYYDPHFQLAALHYFKQYGGFDLGGFGSPF